MKVSEFNYDLPESFIAQTPVEPRDSSRLMVMNRQTGSLEHHTFTDIVDFIQAGDVLVLNTTRVIPARLYAHKAETGGAVEVLLLRQVDETRWRGLVGGRNVTNGVQLAFENSPLTAMIEEELDGAERVLCFSEPVSRYLYDIGYTPLPPYIHTQLEDPERYQTVYGRFPGSAAAPTAGLHFTPGLMAALKAQGVLFTTITLHVGLDTFAPVTEDSAEEHKIHREWCQVSAETAQTINQVKAAGGRVFAVGTTSVRSLESAAPAEGQPVQAYSGETSLYILPGYPFRVVDGMITNFHLPKSTLIMLVSAFAGRETILKAYEIAKREAYRFYSFGDAMLIL